MCVFKTKAGDQQNRQPKRGATCWVDLHIPLVRPESWSIYELREGMRELERLRRETEAAMSLLVGALPESRDTAADIARSTGISNKEAKRRKRIADVVGKVKGALEKLANGSLSDEHIGALAPVADMPGAAELLDNAASSSPEEFTNMVEQFRLSASCGEDMAKRQRTRRALRFHSGPNGMIGLSGLLPPIEGTELKNRLAAIVDAQWRTEHPERARTLGAHGGDTHEQRMADALLAIAGVTSGTHERSNNPPSPMLTQPAASDQDHDEMGNDAGADAGPFDQAGIYDLSLSATGRDSHSEPSDLLNHSLFEDPASSAESSARTTTSANRMSAEDHEKDHEKDHEEDHEERASGVSNPKAHQRDLLFNLPYEPRTSQTAAVAPITNITHVKTAKPAVVIIFDIDRWEARIAGGGPIPITETLLDHARNDLYYCFKNMAGEVLKFGRSRRDPTPIQRLALIVRDERCLYPGCHAPPDRCDVHHTNEVVKDQGLTNLDVMGLFCKSHHRHLHLNDLIAIREPNGNVTIKHRRTGATEAQMCA